MVAFNVSLDDASPLINYSGSWLDTPASDALASNYSASSLHTSSVSGAEVTFAFNGTGVWLYGANRPGYGNYSLSVDGQTVLNSSASAAVPIFDQLLGGLGNMSMGQHTATLNNIGGGPIDLDSLIFETQMGSEDQQVDQTTVDDNDPRISYLPSSAWQVADQDFFANGTVHYAQTTNAQATFTFSGDAVAVYGGASFDHGPFTVSVDGQSQQLNGGGAREYHAQTLLYFSQGLGAGNHQLTLSAGLGFLDLDAVVVYSATGGQNSTSSATPPSGMPAGGNYQSGVMSLPNNGTASVNETPDSSNGNDAADGAAATTKSIPKAVLAAIVAASILGFLSILLIAIFITRRIRKSRRIAITPETYTHSPIFIQDPALESGVGTGSGAANLQRNITMKSFASLYSQNSYYSGDHPPDIEAPPLPPLPAGLATLAVPALAHARPVSISSISTGSATLHSISDGRYDAKVDVDRYNVRQSIGSNTSSTATVAPLRPARPLGLDLSDLEHIPL